MGHKWGLEPNSLCFPPANIIQEGLPGQDHPALRGRGLALTHRLSKSFLSPKGSAFRPPAVPAPLRRHTCPGAPRTPLPRARTASPTLWTGWKRKTMPTGEASWPRLRHPCPHRYGTVARFLLSGISSSPPGLSSSPSGPA